MIYCILGQTASGKTSLAISLARRFHVPVISADAYQCYQMMQIGTDKPKKEEIEGLDFYFTDEYPVDHEMSVFLFQQEMRPLLDQWIKEDKDVLVVGGNFLYVRALFYNYVFQEETNTKQAEYDKLPLEVLQKMLKERDLETYQSIDFQNPRRVIRALVQLDEGRKLAKIREENDEKPLYPVEFLQLEIDKELGNKKIDERVDKMFLEGFPEEVKKLSSLYNHHLRSFQAIGYKECLSALDSGKEIDDEVKELIKIHTHQYAKKQRTFLCHQFPEVKKGTKEEIDLYLTSKLRKEKK